MFERWACVNYLSNHFILVTMDICILRAFGFIMTKLRTAHICVLCVANVELSTRVRRYSRQMCQEYNDFPDTLAALLRCPIVTYMQYVAKIRTHIRSKLSTMDAERFYYLNKLENEVLTSITGLSVAELICICSKAFSNDNRSEYNFRTFEFGELRYIIILSRCTILVRMNITYTRTLSDVWKRAECTRCWFVTQLCCCYSRYFSLRPAYFAWFSSTFYCHDYYIIGVPSSNICYHFFPTNPHGVLIHFAVRDDVSIYLQQNK